MSLVRSTGQAINIIESGSNSNGNYIKFEDGTMICEQRVEKNIAITGIFGQGFYTGVPDLPSFPIEFTDIPTVSVTLESGWASSAIPFGITKSSINYCYVYCYSSNESVKIIFNIIAIGNWK